jgi:DNA-binding CsgD family transcriptional regulator
MRRLPRFAPVWAAQALMTEAEVLAADGKDPSSRWAEAVAAAEPLAYPALLARARLRHAEAIITADAGEGRVRAGELLRQADSVARRLGAAPLAEEIQALAARARLALDTAAGGAAPVPPGDALGLTGRERDVLRLVAAGRSNRQIAEELFISPKTASVHVSNILAKLGVSGRGEAAAMAHRLKVFEVS